jgi:hypothetical protein
MLLEEGWELPEESEEAEVKTPKLKTLLKEKFQTGKYEGNKWGGKYLRAPDIFFTILEKGKGILVRLRDVAEVRRGFTTGCNEFFYLPSKHFDIKKEGKYYELIPKHEGLPKGIMIEEECLRPVIKSSRECESFQIEPAKLKQFLFLPPAKSLGSMEALKYVKWGESKYFHKIQTSAARSKWWYLGDRRIPDIISPCSVSELYRAFENKNVYADKRLYEIYVDKNKKEQVLLSLCSTLATLFLEVGSRTGLGLGLLDLTVYEVADSQIIHPKFLNRKCIPNKRRKVSGVIELGIDASRPIREQKPNPLPDRRVLDNIVFDALGLTEKERDEVYWSVCELVKNRLEKARSV